MNSSSDDLRKESLSGARKESSMNVKKPGERLNIVGGTEEAIRHSYSEDEKIAFTDWINSSLNSDAELKHLLPISLEGMALFRAVEDGILLCKLINEAVPNTIDPRVINKRPSHTIQKHENQHAHAKFS